MCDNICKWQVRYMTSIKFFKNQRKKFELNIIETFKTINNIININANDLKQFYFMLNGFIIKIEKYVDENQDNMNFANDNIIKDTNDKILGEYKLVKDIKEKV